MSDLIRPQWPAKPSNPASSMGAPSNVGGGPDPALIRPQHPALPSNPAGSMGAAPNIGGPDKPVVRGGTDQPTSAGQ